MAVSTGRTSWPSPEVATRNGDDLHARLTAEIMVYEFKYGFNETELLAKLAASETEETYEICEWLMAAEMLRLLSAA